MIRIGTRPSRLALKQVEEVVQMYKIREYEIIEYKTTGDFDKKTPLSGLPEGSDFFTDTIERALLGGEIDIAVHSAKDLPGRIPNGLEVVALTKSINPYDVFVSRKNIFFEKLPLGAIVGVCSARRKKQIANYMPDIKVADVRGNIDERIELLDTGRVDGLILAAAGLIRLGLEKRITQFLPFEIFEPHPMQGMRAVESRADNHRIKKIFYENKQSHQKL